MNCVFSVETANTATEKVRYIQGRGEDFWALGNICITARWRRTILGSPEACPRKPFKTVVSKVALAVTLRYYKQIILIFTKMSYYLLAPIGMGP